MSRHRPHEVQRDRIGQERHAAVTGVDDSYGAEVATDAASLAARRRELGHVLHDRLLDRIHGRHCISVGGSGASPLDGCMAGETVPRKSSLYPSMASPKSDPRGAPDHLRFLQVGRRGFAVSEQDGLEPVDQLWFDRDLQFDLCEAQDVLDGGGGRGGQTIGREFLPQESQRSRQPAVERALDAGPCASRANGPPAKRRPPPAGRAARVAMRGCTSR